MIPLSCRDGASGAVIPELERAVLVAGPAPLAGCELGADGGRNSWHRTDYLAHSSAVGAWNSFGLCGTAPIADQLSQVGSLLCWASKPFAIAKASRLGLRLGQVGTPSHKPSHTRIASPAFQHTQAASKCV